MGWIETFVISIVASVIAYYICKWLDEPDEISPRKKA